MSLKGIELQIAIPKTFDAGKISEQKQQRAQIAQDQANVLTEQQAEKNRETVLEAKEYAKMHPDKKNNENEHQNNEERRNNEGEKKTEHPYKGSFVDFSG